ncbi:MAG: hypothetical protein ACKORL_12590 [Phycisphaerales bacterium]
MNVDPGNPTAGQSPCAPTHTPPSTALGSLAAVAAMVAVGNALAVPPLSDIRVSTTIVNTTLTNGLQLDIDGDSTSDFTILFANSAELWIYGGLSNRSVDTGVSADGQFTYTPSFAPGTSIGSGAQWAAVTALANAYNAGGPGTNFYAGFQFNIGVATHYGWIQFSIPSSSSPFTGATAVAAAWQNTAGMGINAGAVPAPGARAAILGAGLLRTRRRR